jgi:hypothetical protein
LIIRPPQNEAAYSAVWVASAGALSANQSSVQAARFTGFEFGECEARKSLLVQWLFLEHRFEDADGTVPPTRQKFALLISNRTFASWRAIQALRN